jgi:hypothetical protein
MKHTSSMAREFGGGERVSQYLQQLDLLQPDQKVP